MPLTAPRRRPLNESLGAHGDRIGSVRRQAMLNPEEFQ